MKIKITKPIKVTEVGPNKLAAGHECEVSKGCGEILVKRGFAVEVEESKPLSAADTIKLVEAVEKVEDLKAFEADERKTVIEAVENKKAELTA